MSLPTPVVEDGQPPDGARDGQPAWDTVTAEYRVRTSYSLRRFLVEDPDAVRPLDRLDRSFAGKRSDQDIESRVREVFETARALRHGPLIVALYLHARCLEAWEGSTGWDTINQVLAAAAPQHLQGLLDGLPEDEKRLVHLVLEHTQSIGDCMDVESGLNCSCPVAVQERAERVVDRARQTLAALPAEVPAVQGARDYVHMIATTDLTYFSAVRSVGAAVLAWALDDPAARDLVARTVAELAAAEQVPALKGDVYESELRAHRLTLEALLSRFDTPSIHVDRGMTTHIYPFTFARVDPYPLNHESARWLSRHRAELLTWQLCGDLRPTDVRILDINQGLSDMWESSAADRAYRGVRIMMPPIDIRTTDGRQLRGEVEVRLSELGNHHVRIMIPIDEGHPHFVNQALRRGSEHMGDELVTSGSHRKTWTRVATYAHELVERVATRLAEGGAAAGGGDRSAVHGPHHVIMSIRELSILDGGVRRPATGTDLLRTDLLGSSLHWQPVGTTAATLEEWLRYPTPEHRNLTPHRGFVGDLVLQTLNTTVIAMPGKPSFLIATYEEGAEFVATLRATLENWRQILDRVVRTVRGTTSAESVQRKREALEGEQDKLTEIRQHVRSEFALLKSPALCKTAINREYLDALWTATGLDKEEADLEAGMTQAQAAHDESVAAIARLESRRGQRLQFTVNVVVTIVALTGVAELFGLINESFGLGRAAALVELLVVGVLIAVVLVLYFRLRRRSEG